MASESVFNESVSLPTLRRDLRVLPGGVDENGETTWSVFDPVSDKYFRIGWREREIISRFTGRKTIDEALEEINQIGVGVSRKEIVGVSDFLVKARLCLPVPDETATRLEQEREARRGSLWLRVLYSYISFRVPLWKPDEFLSATVIVVGAAFNRWTLLILAILSLWGYARLLPNWNRLAEAFMTSLSVVGLLNYTIAIVAVKFIHELCHAYAAKIFGVRTRELGVAFIVFFPRLYTDLTDSWRIADRRKRLIIDGAGILSELMIGGLAALVWVNTGAGAVHAIAYFLFAVSVINSLLFNGNPLMRFDGYYVLSDAVNIDNLQNKAFGVIKASWREWFWRIPGNVPYGTGKQIALSLYGFAAFAYRLFLYSSIIVIVYYKFTKSLGMTLACVEVLTLLVAPAWRELSWIKRACERMKRRFYLKLILLMAMLTGFLLVPFPVSISLPSEVRPERKSVLYVKTEGFIERIHANDGEALAPDSSLITLRNPFLEMEIRDKIIDKRILTTEMDQLLSRSDTLKNRGIKGEQLKSIDAILGDLRNKERDLQLAADIAGRVLFYNEDMKTGEWLKRGFSIGEVYGPERAVIVAYASESDLPRISANDPVTMCLDKETTAIRGRIEEIQTVPLYRIRSSPLQNVRGGPLSGAMVGGRWKSNVPLFRVIVKSASNLEAFKVDDDEYHLGRSGMIFVKRRVSIASWLSRLTLRFLEQELVF